MKQVSLQSARARNGISFNLEALRLAQNKDLSRFSLEQYETPHMASEDVLLVRVGVQRIGHLRWEQYI